MFQVLMAGIVDGGCAFVVGRVAALGSASAVQLRAYPVARVASVGMAIDILGPLPPPPPPPPPPPLAGAALLGLALSAGLAAGEADAAAPLKRPAAMSKRTAAHTSCAAMFLLCRLGMGSVANTYETSLSVK